MTATLSAAKRALAAVTIVNELPPHHPPTSSQRAVLERFSGWGSAAALFEAQPSPAWARAADELDKLADPTAVAAVSRVVDTSFYTPAPLVGHIYQLLAAAGFTGGRVLDLGCGTGRFLSHVPSDLAIDYVGVDCDPIATRILAALHPQATVITERLEKLSLPSGGFSAAVGNVPFSSANVSDSAIHFYGSLHDYFLVRAVRAVTPGGYVVVVTSRHTLDSGQGLPREVAHRADLIAAVRLPSGYFAAEGTDVVADVLALRVRDKDADSGGFDLPTAGFEYLKPDGQPRWSGQVKVSGYWTEHRHAVAGAMRATGYHQNPLAVDAANRGAAVDAAFAYAAQQVTAHPCCTPAMATEEFDDVILADANGRPEGSFHRVDGGIGRVENGTLTSIARPSKELGVLVDLRDLAIDLLTAEADWERPDVELEPLRAACLSAYQDYVVRFGPLNRGELITGAIDPETGAPKLGWKTPRLGGFRADPDAVVVLALEVFDQESGTASPAPVLRRRVNRRPVAAVSAQTPGEALAIVLGEGRGLVLARVAQLLSLPSETAAFAALGDLVFWDPQTRRPETARDYLSGNVREKLAVAEQVAAGNPEYERNVTALTAVLPRWLGRDEVRIELGSPWVSTRHVEDFCKEVFGAGYVKVSHVALLAVWEVSGNEHSISPAAKISYTTGRKSAFALLQDGLNGASPVIYDEIFDRHTHTTRRVRNSEETELAEQRLKLIAERFSLWVFEDPQREAHILHRYNHAMNAHVVRSDDGSYLTFPHMAEGIELWQWQRNFVDRAISRPAVMAAHSVGLGKTRTAIVTAMTLRQFGIANRVGYIVPNHLIEQCTRELYQTWPGGRFLVVTRDDLNRHGRRLFAARCATGDWDVVVMTHEVFSSIPVPAAVERDWLEDQITDLEDYSRAAGFTAKAVARAVRSLQGRLERLRDINDPSAITFDMLGLDYLAVDEADRFRRLHVVTRAEGFSLGASKRATDLLLKLTMLRRANPGRPHAMFATGTPWTNTLAEAYIWQLYLDPERLKDAGLEAFDGWAAQFVRYETNIEVSPDGSGFRSKRRPSVIQNVPELRTMIGDFMSMVHTSTTGLPLPTANRSTVVVEPSANTVEYMASLVARADALRQRKVTDLRQDNMLAICGDGRKVALDPNLVGYQETSTKLEAVAEEVARIYHATKDTIYGEAAQPGAFQLVLCDLGTPHPGDLQSYGRLRAAMIRRGIPAGKVRFVHEATTGKAREALFAGCRDGSIAVLLGSTPKVGIGTNIQTRLAALHHVDPTWTASAWEQRNGRGIRYGNLNPDVGVVSYVVRNSFDAFMFGIVERKCRGFQQLYLADGQIREIEDLGEAVLSFGELKAAAAGNSLMLRQHELNTTIRRLRLAHLGAVHNVRAALSAAAEAAAAAQRLRSSAERLTDVIDHYDGEMPRVDLQRAVLGYLQGRPQPSWSDGRLVFRFDNNRDGHRFSAHWRYEPLWSAEIPCQIRRRGQKAITAWAHALAAGWLAGTVSDRDQDLSAAAAADRRAQESRSAADATDVGESAELRAALAELDQINRRIEQEIANTDKGVGPAAA